MLQQLEVPYEDARAEDLVWRLGGDSLPALATRTIDLAGQIEVELRLLGTSHQVLLRTKAGELTETVSCETDTPGNLPAETQEKVGTFEYSFTSVVETIEGPAMRKLATQLSTTAGKNNAYLAGTFPGSRDAITVLAASSTNNGVSWRTWHLYPQVTQVVRTVTVVRLK